MLGGYSASLRKGANFHLHFACKVDPRQQRRDKPRSRRLKIASEAVSTPSGVVEVQVIRPAYNKYKTKGELAASDLRRWLDSSAEGVDLPDPTPLSLFLFALGFIKFEVVPEIVRYGWWLVWTPLCEFYYPYHKKLILQGCKLDIYLQQRAYPQRKVHIDRKAVLKRFHWHAYPWYTFKYRAVMVKDILLRKLRQATDSQISEDSSTIGA